jgi:hypothetical protein
LARTSTKRIKNMAKGLPRTLRTLIAQSQEKIFYLSAAQIIAMNATPVTLVPAPGAGLGIVVESVIFKMTRTATAFTGGGTVQFRYTNGAGTEVATALAAAIVTTGGAGIEIAKAALPAPVTVTQNAPVVITNGTAAFAAGTGTAVVYLKYKIA